MPAGRPANTTSSSSSSGGTAAAAAATSREQQQATPAAVAASIASGLASPDGTQQAGAVNQLLTQLGGPALTAAIPAELLSRGVHTRLLELLAASPDKGVHLLAARVLARWAAGGGATSSSSPLQEALLSSMQACQALWAVLEAFEAAQDAIVAALADPAAVRAAAVAVKKDAVDQEEWLPGPSKYLLETVLRTLCSLAAAGGSTADGSSCVAATAWLARQPAATLTCLLRHTSSRIQMRAARLALMLARNGAWCEAFAAGGGLAVALRLAGIPAGGGISPAPVVVNGAGSSTSSSASGGPHVQLAALRLLRRLADSPSTVAGAALAMSREPLLDRLISILVQQQQQPGAAGKSVGGAVNAAASKTASADAARAGAQLSIQQAAADLLASLCAASIMTSRRFVEQRGGGLEMLQALLPDAPQADQQVVGAAQQHAAVAADAGGPRAAVSSTQAGVHASAGNAPAAGTCAVPPLALSASEPRAPSTQPPQPQHAPASSEAAAAHASTSRPGSPSPTATAAGHLAGQPQAHAAALPKALNPELQAKVLDVAAAVLSHPDLVASLLETGRASQLPRQLLHLFAAAVPAAAPVGACSSAPAGAAGSTTSRSVNGAPADAAGAATAASQATSSKAAWGLASSSAGGSSSSGGKSSASPTPRGSSLAGKAALSVSTAGLQPEGCSSPQFAASAAAAATPRKAGVGAVKAIATTPPPPDPLVPPFPACVKAPALACLAALVQHTAGATHLAAQRASSSSGGGPDACSMLCQVLLDVQQLCGSSQAGGCAPDGGQALLPRMLPAAAADLLAALTERLQDTACLAQLPVLDTLKVLARVAEGSGCASEAQTKAAMARALMLLPDTALEPPPRPPLPSPPPTPPPPPLPTSVAAWDALGRPCMTDGSIVVA